MAYKLKRDEPMKKWLVLCGIAICYPLLVGTTYIIKEGGKEVGRMEDKDGKNGIEIIENEKRISDSPKVSAPNVSRGILVLADFNSGDKPNNVGGDFGGWDKDPNDSTQGCQLSFDTDNVKGQKSGYSIRLTYDVDSPNLAYNGFWMKLNGVNAMDFNTLNFYAKGDLSKGYPSDLCIQLQDNVEQEKRDPGSMYFSNLLCVPGLSRDWQKFSVPFSGIPNLVNRGDLRELLIVFRGDVTYPKTGAVLIDQVYLSREE